MARMFFNEIEAIKIAQNMERRGLEFYQQAAAKARDPATRAVFLDLAEDEKKHLARFQEVEEHLQARRREGAGYSDEEEIGAYIDRLLETQVFSEEGGPARLAGEIRSDYEALAVGIRSERDAILFYQEMIDFVDSKDARDAFQAILAEEREHLKDLGDRSEHCENYRA